MCYATQLSPQSSDLYSELQALLSAVPLLQGVGGVRPSRQLQGSPQGDAGDCRLKCLHATGTRQPALISLP